MGCTHSKNSKSKSAVAKSEQPLERTLHGSRIAHFDESRATTESTSQESEDVAPQKNQFSKSLLNETRESTAVVPDKSAKKVTDAKSHQTTGASTDQHNLPPQNSTQNKPHTSETPIEPVESVQHTAVPPTQKQYAASTYYPMPIVGEKQKSPEKKKQVMKTMAGNEEKKKKKEEKTREKSAMIGGPNYRPQLTPDDLEYIRRSVQQRNER
ncbi:hypothetical protein GCK72_000442 [Caenorhabditis remanei]|uniref:Uncharacterized protein n=1 Tax=Caenorhabditis remanei TaxID=31234 RepID=A0A6A5HKC7_CAERE|nr:hypothetical protein GCK72_000442 [Caenorhabditis remanei]KAF1768630.1 hypothetical protein GCK72_000442 [Caenorhabditis remanei]